MTQVENVTHGMATAHATATTKNANTNVIPPAVTWLPLITHSQLVEVHCGQLPHTEIKDGAKQELEEGNHPTSASVTRSTVMTDVVPSPVQNSLQTSMQYTSLSLWNSLLAISCHAVDFDYKDYFLLIE